MFKRMDYKNLCSEIFHLVVAIGYNKSWAVSGHKRSLADHKGVRYLLLGQNANICKSEFHVYILPLTSLGFVFFN